MVTRWIMVVLVIVYDGKTKATCFLFDAMLRQIPNSMGSVSASNNITEEEK